MAKKQTVKIQDQYLGDTLEIKTTGQNVVLENTEEVIELAKLYAPYVLSDGTVTEQE